MFEGFKEKVSHLKEGVKPIMACVGEECDFEGSTNPMGNLDRLGRYSEQYREDVAATQGYANVDYYAKKDVLESNEYKNGGENTYVISKVDSKDKLSVSYANCTGVVVSGQDKETGENISFLSHQDPWFFVRNEDKKNRFLEDLRSRLQEIKDRSEQGTLDARIVGGNYIDRNKGSKEDYTESIKLLSKEINSTLGFEPTVITGPKLLGGQDDVFFDNKNKRLYISRPKVGDKTTEPYEPKNLGEQLKKMI